jgi:type 1 glutamine amidotransferase
MTVFHPPLADYDVVLSNYNGESWLPESAASFARYVRDGGGFVCIHAANNAFPDWDEYNKMIGLGGWGGRTELAGPYVYLNESDEMTRDRAPGPGGNHGPQREFEVVIRDSEHPITAGMVSSFMHAKDELYDRLRGPAENMRILATAFAAKHLGGRDCHEPMAMIVEYGEGRVFHTTLGHATYSMKGDGFVALLQRGSEWAATGNVTIPLPESLQATTD